MTTLYLIRHAEAEGNVYRRVHGQYDALLTERGMRQLPCVAKRFENTPLSAVYSSNLYRARYTAKAIADLHNLRVKIDPVLREIDMGDWEDLTWAELPRCYPEVYRHWQEEPSLCVVPGGESVLAAGERVFAKLQQIAARHDGEEIAVVSHGSAIRGCLMLALGIAPENIGEIGWGDNTCVAKLLFENGNCRAEYWNDATHLPAELSTFAAIGWKDVKAGPHTIQMWYRPYDAESAPDRELLLQFFREVRKNAYGAENLPDADEILSLATDCQGKCARAVTFGILEEEPAALIFLNVCDESEPTVGKVGAFCIREEYRGCGLSQQVLGQAISVYRTLGKAYLCAYVAEKNERAQGFYKKFAFQNEGAVDRRPFGTHFRMMKSIRVVPVEEESADFEI